jgi:hypothetical protein
MDNSALKQSAVFGSVMQIIMVLIAKFVPSIGGGDTFLPAVGTALAALAGLKYTRAAGSGAMGSSVGGGIAAGGISSLVGSALAGALGLAPGAIVQTIGIATGSGAVAGIVGSVIGRFLPGAKK